MPIKTTAGLALIAQVKAEERPLVIDEFVYAYIAESVEDAGYDFAPGDIVATQPVTQKAFVNPDTVVYSSVLGTTDGDFTFNAFGIRSSVDDVLLAYAIVPEQIKTATNGNVVGNTLTKNFLLKFEQAQSTTQINITAETWQLDYTGRLENDREMARNTLAKFTGNPVFKDTGFEVTGSAENFSIALGDAIVEGLPVSMLAPVAINVPATAIKTVYLDVTVQTSMSASDVVLAFYESATPVVDFIDANGNDHYVVELASIETNGAITDLRKVVDRFDGVNRGNWSELVTDDPVADPQKLASAKLVEDTRVPVGGIIMWSGTVATIPGGWALCDGQNGTPDLEDKFIIGGGAVTAPGTTLGSKSKTTDSKGSHSHSITVNSHTLTLSQSPAHNHYLGAALREYPNNFNFGSTTSGPTRTEGASGASVNDAHPYTSTSGSGNSHNHGGSSASAGNHTHAIADIRPPSYALAYIMKL